MIIIASTSSFVARWYLSFLALDILYYHTSGYVLNFKPQEALTMSFETVITYLPCRVCFPLLDNHPGHQVVHE